MPSSVQITEDISLAVEALTPSAFAEFGTVIQNAGRASFPVPPASVEANQGSATKYSDVSPLISSYDLGDSGKPVVPRISMFSCRPRALQRDIHGKQVFKLGILERHPFTPQTFIPMGLSASDRETAYLVIVAPTSPHTDKRSMIPTYTVPDRPLPSSVSPHNQIAVRTATPKSSGPPDLTNIKAFIARGDQAVTYGAGTWHAPMVVLGRQTIDFVVLQYANGVALEDCQEVEISGSSISVRVDEHLISRPDAKL